MYSRFSSFLVCFAILAWTGCSENPVEPETAAPVDIRLSGADAILGVGGSLQLKATVIGEGGSALPHANLVWSSSEASVAEVDASGLVTSVGHGESIIRATSGMISASRTITVHGSGDFKYPSGDVTLSSRLTLPAGNGPFPAVVTVHGSEAARKENYQISSLIQQGFAVLSYDKRGVGESTGVCPCPGGVGLTVGNSKEMLQLLAGDALAGVAFLKRHHDIDSTRIGLVGWSQAGWIIPIAASRSDDLAFMVNVVGPTVTVGEEIYYSNLTGDSGTGPLPGGRSLDEIYAMVEQFTGNHGFDPVPILRRVDVPGLWPLGGMDRSIPTPITIARIEELVDELGKPFTVHLYPNGNHGLVDVSTGVRIQHFTMPGGTTDWIRKQIGITQ
jgi:dienelactone hydrolase